MKPVEDLQKIKGIGKVTVQRVKDSGVTAIVEDGDTAPTYSVGIYRR